MAASLLLPFILEHIQTVGFIAGSLTTIAFAPQVHRTWRTGGRDLSWPMLALFGTGVGLWLLYGLAVASAPIIAANSLTGLQVLLIAALTYRSYIRASETAN